MRETYVTYRLWNGCGAPNNLERGSRIVGQIVRSVSVDRDALLALADELESEGLEGWASGPVNVGEFARRIREAVGA